MTLQPSEQPRTALREFVEEASSGPWRRETGVAPSEEEHMVWLTNEAGDSLLVNADDVAMLVNAAIEAAAPDPVASPPDLRPALREIAEGPLTPGAWDGWKEVGRLQGIARAALAVYPGPVASPRKWDYNAPHPFESKDLGNPTYDFCICERRRTDAMHLPDPVASPPALDVGRLARALEPVTRPLYAGEDVAKWRSETAERLATEYARLAEGQPVAEEPA